MTNDDDIDRPDVTWQPSVPTTWTWVWATDETSEATNEPLTLNNWPASNRCNDPDCWCHNPPSDG